MLGLDRVRHPSPRISVGVQSAIPYRIHLLGLFLHLPSMGLDPPCTPITLYDDRIWGRGTCLVWTSINDKLNISYLGQSIRPQYNPVNSERPRIICTPTLILDLTIPIPTTCTSSHSTGIFKSIGIQKTDRPGYHHTTSLFGSKLILLPTSISLS